MLEVACPWHGPLWASLTTQTQHAHAYLFSGLPGVGKRRFANAFAAYLLCDKPEHGMACGHCRACQLREAGSRKKRARRFALMRCASWWILSARLPSRVAAR